MVVFSNEGRRDKLKIRILNQLRWKTQSLDCQITKHIAPYQLDYSGLNKLKIADTSKLCKKKRRTRTRCRWMFFSYESIHRVVGEL